MVMPYIAECPFHHFIAKLTRPIVGRDGRSKPLPDAEARSFPGNGFTQSIWSGGYVKTQLRKPHSCNHRLRSGKHELPSNPPVWWMSAPKLRYKLQYNRWPMIAPKCSKRVSPWSIAKQFFSSRQYTDNRKFIGYY